TLDVGQVIEEVLKRIAAAGDDRVWITRTPDEHLRAAAVRLDARRGEINRLPLYGVPFAVKDNIDVANLPTTAACPGFSYQPQASAETVRRLPGRRALALRGAEKSIRSGVRAGRLQLGLGRCRRRGPGELRARHRHG